MSSITALTLMTHIFLYAPFEPTIAASIPTYVVCCVERQLDRNGDYLSVALPKSFVGVLPAIYPWEDSAYSATAW